MKKLFILGMVLFSANVFAGNEKGNGGVSVVCRDKAQNIISAEVLDIYEGKVRWDKVYKNNHDGETKLKLAKLLLVNHPTFLNLYQAKMDEVMHIVKFVMEGNELLPTNDAYPLITKKGCNFEQLANYTNDGDLLISQEIYRKLDHLNYAALLIHEAVYAALRDYGATDSRQARRLTAELLAENPDQRVIDRIIGMAVGPTGPIIVGPGQGEVEVEVEVPSCGTYGSIERRISSCNYRQGHFALVTRTSKGKEVYKDLISGLIWSDIIDNRPSNHNDAQNLCALRAGDEMGYHLDWRLPTLEQFLDSGKHGLNDLPSMKLWYWTSSLLKYDSSYVNAAYAYTGSASNFYTIMYLYDDQSNVTRCVSRLEN